MLAKTLTQDSNTNCFTCGRWYFHVALDRCPRCGSDSVEHYTVLELGLLSRTPERIRGSALIDRRLDERKRAA